MGRPEGVHHWPLRAAHHDHLAGCPGHRGHVADQPAQVGGSAQQRDLEHDRIDAGVGLQHRQDAGQHAGIGEHLGGEIDRVRRGREVGQRGAQDRGGLGAELGGHQSHVRAEVHRQHAEAARVGEDRHPRPRRAVVQEGLGQGEQLGGIGAADRAPVVEHRVVDRVLARERAGVRGGGAAAGRAPARLQHEHRHPASMRARERLAQPRRVLHVLEIQAGHARLGILHDLGEDLGGLHVRLVAGAHPVVEAEARGARHLVEHAGHRSALADHRDGADREVGVEEGRGEGRHQTRGQVSDALAVGADDAQPGARGEGAEPRLRGAASLSHLGEAAAEDDGGLHAPGRGGLQRLLHALRRHHHHREVHRIGDRGERRKRGQALHGGARGVHRIDAPRVAVTEQEREWAAADLDRVVGGAHHRDGARPEHRGEPAHGSEYSVYDRARAWRAGIADTRSSPG